MDINKKCPYARACDAGRVMGLCNTCGNNRNEPTKQLQFSFYAAKTNTQPPRWYNPSDYQTITPEDPSVNTVYCNRDCVNQQNGRCIDAGVAIDSDGYCTGYQQGTCQPAGCKECTEGRRLNLCGACPAKGGES